MLVMVWRQMSAGRQRRVFDSVTPKALSVPFGNRTFRHSARTLNQEVVVVNKDFDRVSARTERDLSQFEEIWHVSAETRKASGKA